MIELINFCFWGIGVLTFACILLAAGFGIAEDWRIRKYQKFMAAETAAQSRAAQESRLLVGRDADLFSEDEPTYLLLKDLADGMPARQARDRWRERRKPVAPTPNPSEASE